MKLVGLDIGFGDTKIVTREKMIKFPTAIAHAPSGGVDLGAFGKAEKVYQFGGHRYIVGRYALAEALPTRDIKFLMTYAPLLTSHAKSLAEFNTIAIGLPIGYYSKAKEFKAILSEYTVDRRVETHVVHVLPQGVGILYDYLGEKNIQTVADCIVLDVGFNTVDVLTVIDGKVSREYSGMLEGRGICQIVANLAATISKTYNDNLTEQEVKSLLLSKTYKQYGTKYDMSRSIANITYEYAERLLSEVTQRWDRQLKRSDRILLAGGGAYFLKNSIPEKYCQMVETVRPNVSEYSNAVGFYRYLETFYAKNIR